MSLVKAVVDAVNQRGGVISLPELSKDLGIQPAALQGILVFCAQKGYLKLDFSDAAKGCQTCSVSDCSSCVVKK